MAQDISLNERADALEREMSDELDVLISKSALFNMADGKLGASGGASELTTRAGKYYLMDDDPRLPKMPAKPTHRYPSTKMAPSGGKTKRASGGTGLATWKTGQYGKTEATSRVIRIARISIESRPPMAGDTPLT